MSNPSHVDPSIPLQESTSAELTRLSSDITTLTDLMENSERRSLEHLTAMFARSRKEKVEQALACVARSR